MAGALRHLAYAGGWKKFEWLWHALIRMKQVTRGLPLLEKALDLGGKKKYAAVENFNIHHKRDTLTVDCIAPAGIAMECRLPETS
jgi:hypothetical protein